MDDNVRLKDFEISLPELDTPGGLQFFKDLTPERLFELGLPPRPNKLTERALHKHWVEMLENVVRTEEAVFSGDLGSVSMPQVSPTRIETSRNWSGARRAPSHGQRFDRVIGRWKIPRVRRATAATPLQPNCSIWIGFGGHRRWSKEMPQVGTEHRAETFDGTSATRHVVWIQWWVRGNTTPPFQAQILAQPTIMAGDTILCWIELLSARKVRFYIRKRGDSVLYRKELDTTTSTVRGVDAYGSSAEWIVERPRDPTQSPPQLFPLADFKKIRFTRCAVSAGGGQHSCPRIIRMVEKQRSPQRLTTISMPRTRGALNGGRLLVKRRGPRP